MNRKQIASLVAKSETLAYTRSTAYSTDLYHVVDTLMRHPDGRLFRHLNHLTGGVGPDTITWVSTDEAIDFLVHDVTDCDHVDASFTRAEAVALVTGVPAA